MLSLPAWTHTDTHISPRDRMVPKDRSADVHAPPPQPHKLETAVKPVMVLDSEGRSLQQGDGNKVRKRVGTLALYSRALSGCHGVRGLLPEPLCEMRTLQKHSLERDRKSTVDCSDRAAVKAPLASSSRDSIWISGRAKESHPKTTRNKTGNSSHDLYPGKTPKRFSNCYFGDILYR